jgi:hypothetical protein
MALKDLVDFPAYLTPKLGNIDSRNITCAVALATLDGWEIPHIDGVAHVRRGVARNLRREWFGSKGTRVRPAGEGTMVFPLFDGFLRLEFAEPETWHEAFGRPEPGVVRLSIERSDNERRPH